LSKTKTRQEYDAKRSAACGLVAVTMFAPVAIMKMNREIDVRHVLPAIQVPTVVLHRSAERVIDIANARYMVEHIPGAKLIELPGFDHNYFVADRDALLDQVEAFLTGARHVHQPERVLTTVLFTDIVASTERAAALGDDAWRELLEALYAKFERCCSNTAGVRSTPQAIAFCAAFESPARAIRCAGAICNAVRALGLEVRCGVHTGECDIIGNDLAGIAVRGAGKTRCDRDAARSPRHSKRILERIPNQADLCRRPDTRCERHRS
jgi:hypothetical protein